MRAERLDASARRALYLARAQAASVGAAHIEPQHVLAGLLRGCDATIFDILGALGVDLRALEHDCEAAMPLSPRSDDELRFSRSARTVAEVAQAIADEVHCSVVVPYCLLLALLRERDTSAAQLLQRHGVEYEAALRVVRGS